MSSGMSGAYQAALSAKTMVEERLPDLRVDVVDTKQIMMCQGWVVIEAARAAMEGKSLSDIVDLANKIAPRACMIQTADTLRYLYMGGRIGKASSLFGTMLNIKPIVGMEDGVIVPLGKARSRGKAYVTMADMVEQAVGKLGKIKVAYVHAAAREAAEKIRDLVEARVDCIESIFAEHSPSLSVHTGPGTAGICYFPVESE
jgi:DegV family protein with EDD domain